MNTFRSLAALSALSLGLLACADGPTAPRQASIARASREAQPGDDRGGHGKDDPTVHFSREAQPGDDRGGRREVQPGDDRGPLELQPADDKGAGEVQPGDRRRGRGTDGATTTTTTVIRTSGREAQPGDDRGGHGKDDATPHF